MQEYAERLKTYAKHIEICGDFRNSYAKTDHDATFMRLKRDYMAGRKKFMNVKTAVDVHFEPNASRKQKETESFG